MSTYEITFSPTGGTKKVSGLFTQKLDPESIFVDLTDRHIDFSAFSFHAEDVCVVAVPSYGGRVPQIAVSRLKQMKGGGASAILIAVYGNRAYEDTLSELQDTLSEAGFLCMAAIASIAEHSIMHDFAAGRPDGEDAGQLAEFAHRVGEIIQAGALPEHLDLPGNRPYRVYNGIPMKPKPGKSCTKCGLCSKRCPVGAIDSSNPAKTNAEICISCMRCVAECPVKSRSVNKLLVNAASAKMKKSCEDYKRNELYL